MYTHIYIYTYPFSTGRFVADILPNPNNHALSLELSRSHETHMFLCLVQYSILQNQESENLCPQN